MKALRSSHLGKPETPSFPLKREPTHLYPYKSNLNLKNKINIYKYYNKYVRYRMSKKLKTFEAEENDYVEFKAICAKERIGVGDKLNEFIAKYLKEHGDGNPQFTLEQFKDPDFIACPAFYRDGDSWDRYMAKATPEEKEKLKAQIILIDKKLGKHL